MALDPFGANVSSWTMAHKERHANRPRFTGSEIIPQTATEMRDNVAGIVGVRLNQCGLGDEATEIEMWISSAKFLLTSLSLAHAWMNSQSWKEPGVASTRKSFAAMIISPKIISNILIS